MSLIAATFAMERSLNENFVSCQIVCFSCKLRGGVIKAIFEHCVQGIRQEVFQFFAQLAKAALDQFYRKLPR